MMLGVPFARWMALLCAVLVMASTARTAHAMAETYLHANAAPHAASVFIGLAHDHETPGEDHGSGDDHGAGDGHHDDGDHHDGVGHHAGESGHTNEDDHSAADHDQDGDDHRNGVGHHHHADLNADTVDTIDHRLSAVVRPFELVGVRLRDAAVRMPPGGIERPPRS